MVNQAAAQSLFYCIQDADGVPVPCDYATWYASRQADPVGRIKTTLLQGGQIEIETWFSGLLIEGTPPFETVVFDGTGTIQQVRKRLILSLTRTAALAAHDELVAAVVAAMLIGTDVVETLSNDQASDR